ncbi:MAG: hypothetical protein IJX34_04155 [Clostridia bacterium]|nr:hypothetical protein [Clostridia bacterium]
MNNNILKKLANGETTISSKIYNFNLRVEELKDLKIKLEVSSEDKVLDKKNRKMYFSKLYELQTLFSEIEEDNIVYFRGTLNSIVSNLKNKLDSVNIRK